MTAEQDDNQTRRKARRRSSVWSTFGEAREKQPPKPPAPKPRRSFYVVLTMWSGRRLAIRYTSGQEFPMERFPGGGTYLIFPNGMLFVRESTEEINARIHERLKQLQAAWVAEA